MQGREGMPGNEGAELQWKEGLFRMSTHQLNMVGVLLNLSEMLRSSHYLYADRNESSQP